MGRVPIWLIRAAIIAAWVAVAASCSPVQKPSAPAVTPTPIAHLPADDATRAALQSAAHIVRDSVPQEVRAEFTTLAAGLDAKGLTSPLVSPFRPGDDTPVWIVTLTGYFWEPTGDAAGPPGSLEPVCGQVTVFVDDDTGDYLLLTFARDAACGERAEEPALSPSCSPGAGAALSEEDAVRTATEQAAHLIRDATVQRTTVQVVSYEAAIATLASGPGDPDYAPGRCVWVVTLGGMFYPRRLPPAPGSLVAMPERACAQISVIVRDDAEDFLRLKLERTQGC